MRRVEAYKVAHPRKLGQTGILRKMPTGAFQWNHRPCFPYVGKPRTLGGVSRDKRDFSISENPNAIKWTVDDQAWAVREGFFFQREVVRDAVVIVNTDPYDPTFSYYRPLDAYTELERRMFARRPGYERAFAFLEQQDRFGYTGAWDESIQNFTLDLLWFKMRYRDKSFTRWARLGGRHEQPTPEEDAKRFPAEATGEPAGGQLTLRQAFLALPLDERRAAFRDLSRPLPAFYPPKWRRVHEAARKSQRRYG